MKMADKKIGSIGIYKRYNGTPMKFLERMRIGCDIGRCIACTKNWYVMIGYGKFTNICEFLYQLTIGNIRYLWYKLTRRG